MTQTEAIALLGQDHVTWILSQPMQVLDNRRDGAWQCNQHDIAAAYQAIKGACTMKIEAASRQIPFEDPAESISTGMQQLLDGDITSMIQPFCACGRIPPACDHSRGMPPGERKSG